MTWRRRVGGLIVAALMLVPGVAGCTAQSTASGTQPTSGPHPVVVPAQAALILDQVDAAVTQVVQAGAVTPVVNPRVGGPFRDGLMADLKVGAATKTAVPAPVVSRQRLLVPAQTGWPRWFAVVGEVATRPTPVVEVLYSASARAPYALWGQLTLLPGATLPEVAPVAAGAAALAPDAGDFGTTPTDVAAHYADLLNRGFGSPYAALFAPDAYRDEITQRLANDRSRVAAIGTITSTHTLRPGSVIAVHTADGGALVVAALEQQYVITVRKGAGQTQVDAGLAALAGRATFSQKITRTTVELIALTLPPAGTHDPIRLVAASKTDIAVVGN